MKILTTLLGMAVALPLCACSTLEYDDPDKVETLTIDFGSTDLQVLAGNMVESLNADKDLDYITTRQEGQDPRPVVYIGRVENRTSEHIDTQAITDSMLASLMKGDRLRFTASNAEQGEIGEQVRFQQGSGRVDPEQARAFGHQVGADLILSGTLRSIEKEKGRSLESGGSKKSDVWYQLVLSCVDINSGLIIWSNEENIRKTEKKGLFGS